MEWPASKRRPALVVSSRSFNDRNGHSVMAMITTAKREIWPDDMPIAMPKSAGLNQECVVRWKLFTLPNSFVTRVIGELSAKDKSAMQARWMEVFGA